MAKLDSQLSGSLTALRAVAQNRDLRRLQLAGLGSIIGGGAYLVALVVYAYDQGGAAAVGVVSFLRLIPAALSAPLVSSLGDRFRRRTVLIATDVVRALLMGLAALLILVDGPPAAVYAVVCLTSIAATAFRPAQAAITPGLARTPQELAAANAAASTITSVGGVLGPALGAVFLAATSTELVFALNGLSFVWSAALLLGIRRAEERPATHSRNPIGREALAGFPALLGDRDMRFLTGLYGAQALVAGTTTVFVAVLALEVLDKEQAWVGVLTTALGIGGIVGGVVALALVGRARLGSDFLVGLLLFGAPYLLVAAAPEAVVALVAFTLMGLGNTLVDVSGVGLTQRAVSDAVLARAFGTLQSILLAAVGLGSLVAPLLVSALGARGALVASGALLPALAVLGWRRLRGIDAKAPARTRELELLVGNPLFSPLPARTLELLAGELAPIRVPAGEPVVRLGEPGDRYYLIASGTVHVQHATGPPTALGPGEGFGEIALLHDVPRTATVSADGNVELYALGREQFLEALTGSAPSLAAADEVIGARLAESASRAAPA
ncbi:MAG TPA: MFS transporter [Gaiellaceae bacterium]